MIYTIQHISDITGLTAHTLRYYERNGLIDPIERDANGYRTYNEDDLGRINMICCLRRTGMSIADMQSYASLVRAGEHTTDQRRALLENHREQVETQIEELHDMLDIIKHKIAHYTPVESYE